jgi:hypothetical protein
MITSIVPGQCTSDLEIQGREHAARRSPVAADQVDRGPAQFVARASSISCPHTNGQRMHDGGRHRRETRSMRSGINFAIGDRLAHARFQDRAEVLDGGRLA